MNRKIIDRNSLPVNDMRGAYMEFASMLAAMTSVGLEPNKDVDMVPDGKLRRYRVRGDKAGSKNGWYVLHEHPILAGAFGSWKTGESHNWREVRDRPPTREEREALRQAMQAAQAARVLEQATVHEQAREKAESLWSQAKPATNNHPYLQKKQVPAVGIRQLREQLLIPLRDAHGMLHSLQFIGADGSKKFLTGGRVAGCYFAMGRPRNALLLCEGYATAATVFAATGEATALAFNAGNLPTVARALRSKFPHIKIVVCADDDAGTPGNPGVTKATEAALAVRGVVAVPRLREAANV
ncbi:MAG: hypothetical protein Q8O81_13840 [Giesbergeria sp.]|nr:hypothetical protein [Giesbergeria sp.]